MENPCRELRQLLGVNQAEFARLIGRSFQSVRAYEKHPGDIPQEIVEKLKTLAAETGHADWAVALLSDDWRVVSILHPGETLISTGARKSIPTKKSGKTLSSGDAGSCDAVLSLLRELWHDPRCRQCIYAIARIFEVNDPDIVDAIARNCVQFGRLSDAVAEAIHNKQHGAGNRAKTGRGTDHQGRMDELLASETELDQADQPPKEATGNPGTGRDRVGPVAERPVRPTGSGRKNRG